MLLNSDFPNSIIVRVIPKPTKGLAVAVYFEMRKKNKFTYITFLNDDGISDIRGDELLRMFDVSRHVFLMDYVDPRTNFTGKITTKVLSDLDLIHAAEGLEAFQGKVAFPPDYEKNLREAVRRGQDPIGYAVEVVTKY